MELLFSLLFANDIISDKALKVLEALLGFVSDEKAKTEKMLEELNGKIDRNYAAIKALYAQFGDFLLSYYEEAAERLADASEPNIKKSLRLKLIDEARQKFEEASSKTRTALPLVAAKAQVGVATCYELLNETSLAVSHFKRAYEIAESNKNYIQMKMICQKLYPSVRYRMPDPRYNSPSNVRISLLNLNLAAGQIAGELIMSGRLSQKERLEFKQYFDNATEVIGFLRLLAPALILRNIHIPVETLERCS